MTILNVGNRINNNYIIKLKQGYLIIDTGYPEQFNSFQEKLKLYNIELNQIEYVFLTHAHDDHAGFLNEILDNTNAKAILHKDAVNRLKKGQNSFEGGCTSYLALLFCKLMKLFGKGEHLFPVVNREDRYIVLDKHTQPLIEKEIPGSIINLPGHTSDSIGLLLNDGTLFCGDAAMNGFPSLKRMTIWVEDLDDFIRSWQSIISWNPKKIYPSHGKPFLVDDLRKYVKSNMHIKLYTLS